MVAPRRLFRTVQVGSNVSEEGDPIMRSVVISEAAVWAVPWYAYCVEFEQVLVELLDADVIEVRPRSGRLAKAAQSHYRLRNAASRVPAARPYSWNPQQQRYDLAVVVVSDLSQLSLLTALPGWRSIADRFVAYVFEVWPAWVPAARRAISGVVDRLDHLFVGIEMGVDDLRAASSRPVTFLPPAVDVLQVAAIADPQGKRIDVSNRGRRDTAQHAALQEWARTTGGFYEFDTGPLKSVESPSVHRRHFYEQTARSHLFVANSARFDMPELHRGQSEFGLRYFEALACGTVIAGQHPSTTSVERTLGADVHLLSLPVGADTLPGPVREVLGDAALATELGLENRRVALTRHDVLHRWEFMSATLELPEPVGVEARRQRLAAAHTEITRA
jgi:hypothetical protein